MMKFEGIMPALVTPLNADESINVDVLRALIKHLLDKDADGFYIGGATGEGLAIRTEERMILAEESIAAVDHKKPCIVQIASMDFGDAIALAKHAERIGADAISATPPLFFAYDEDDVYNLTKAIFDNASAIAAENAKGNELSIDNAVSGMAAPFHAGAAKYFAEKGATVNVG